MRKKNFCSKKWERPDLGHLFKLVIDCYPGRLTFVEVFSQG